MVAMSVVFPERHIRCVAAIPYLGGDDPRGPLGQLSKQRRAALGGRRRRQHQHRRRPHGRRYRRRRCGGVLRWRLGGGPAVGAAGGRGGGAGGGRGGGQMAGDGEDVGVGSAGCDGLPAHAVKEETDRERTTVSQGTMRNKRHDGDAPCHRRPPSTLPLPPSLPAALPPLLALALPLALDAPSLSRVPAAAFSPPPPPWPSWPPPSAACSASSSSSSSSGPRGWPGPPPPRRPPRPPPPVRPLRAVFQRLILSPARPRPPPPGRWKVSAQTIPAPRAPPPPHCPRCPHPRRGWHRGSC